MNIHKNIVILTILTFVTSIGNPIHFLEMDVAYCVACCFFFICESYQQLSNMVT